MTEYLIGVVAAALVNDVTLNRMYGFDASDTLTRLRRAAYLGVVTAVVTLAASAAAYVLYYGVLSPLGLQAAWILLFLLVLAACAALSGTLARNGDGEFATFAASNWPLVTLNGAVLGAMVHGVGDSFAGTVLSALAASVIFGAALVLLTAIQARMDVDALPVCVRGWPALLLTAALIAMALMAFNGL